MTRNDKRRFGLISREERKGSRLCSSISSSTVLFCFLFCFVVFVVFCFVWGAHRTSKIVDWFNRFLFAAVVVVEGSDDVDL